MKIVDVLQRYEDEDEIIWTFIVDDVKKEYLDKLMQIDEDYGYIDNPKDAAIEVNCVTKNGKVVQSYDINLQYYFDDYELIDILNGDEEAIKCIEDFVRENGDKLPNSEDMGQMEYSDVVKEILGW